MLKMKQCIKKTMAILLVAMLMSGIIAPAGQAAVKKVTVTTQDELEEALAKAEKTGEKIKIVIKSPEKVTFTIPKGEYSGAKIVVKAENAKIKNHGTVKRMEVKDAKKFVEFATGNDIVVSASKVEVNVKKDASVDRLKFTKTEAENKVVVNGSVEKVTVAATMDMDLTVNGKVATVNVQATADIVISGKTEVAPVVNVSEAAEGVAMKTSVPVMLETKVSVEVKLEAGAEGTEIVTKAEDVDVSVENKTDDKIIIKDTEGNKTEVEAGESTAPSEKTDDGNQQDNSTGGSAGGSAGGSTGGYVPSPTPVQPTVQANATYTLHTECHDWGEAIGSIVIDMGVPVDVDSVDVSDFEYTVSDYSYMDYNTFQQVTGTITRTIEAVTVEGSIITLDLKTENDSMGSYNSESVEKANLALKGTVTTEGKKVEAIFRCTGVVNPIVDSFLEKETENLEYRLFVPAADKQTGENPLLVWLHGAGETGSDNRIQITANLVTNFATEESQEILDNAFVLAPQYDDKRGAAGTWGHNPEWIMEAIEEVCEEYQIDQNRIYVGGCSMGGLGTVNMLTAYPTFFAAAFPICPAGTLTPEVCAAIASPAAVGGKTTAIYLIHCIEDSTCTPVATYDSYNNMVAAYENIGMEKEDMPVYAALFSAVGYDGCPEELQAFFTHFSWVYAQNNFDGLGDDYDGRYFISSNEDRDWNTNEQYIYCVSGGSVVLKKEIVVSATYDGEDVTKSYQWLQYMIPDYDPTKLQLVTNTEYIHIQTARPSEISPEYADFFSWLAAQTKESTISYSLHTECHDWGEAIGSIVIDMGVPVDVDSVDVSDFEYTVSDYSYMDYNTFQQVTATITRTIEAVTVEGSIITLDLKTENDSMASYNSASVEKANLALKGNVTTGGKKIAESTFRCTGVVNPIVDSFLEKETENLEYRLFVPAADKQTGDNPLLVWLHGAGETGSDNRIQITANLVTNFATEESQEILDNAFVLAPQYDDKRGAAGTWGHNPEWIMEAIEEVCAEYQIDQDRIYVGGCSMGGLGTVNMLTAYPTFFAAAFPICPAGTLTPEVCAAIASPAAVGGKTTAIYLIHCIEDSTCTPVATYDSYNNMVAAYESIGMKKEDMPVYAALFSAVGYDGCPEEMQAFFTHFSWVYAQNNFDGLGDDYDGRYFISSNVDRDWNTNEQYIYCVSGGSIVLKKEVVVSATYEEQDVTEYYQWLQYMIPDYDPTKLQLVTNTEYIYIQTARPCEINPGYADFFSWLAAQIK